MKILKTNIVFYLFYCGSLLLHRVLRFIFIYVFTLDVPTVVYVP